MVNTSDDIPEPVRRRPNWFLRYHYRLALPMIWTVCTLVSWKHPGDEYGLFAVGSMAGAWILMLVKFIELKEVISLIVMTGAPVTALVGWLLDHLRVPRALWFPLLLLVATGLVAQALSQYPSFSRAIAKNGSITAYVSAAMNLSLTATSVLLCVIYEGIRLAARVRGKPAN